MSRDPFKYPVYRVKWEDSRTVVGWHAPENDPEQTLCVTVGFLITRSRSLVRLAGSVSGDGTVCDEMIIPRSVVTEMERLS